VTPPLDEADQLLWNGRVLQAETTIPGTYRVEAPGAARSAPLWPQMDSPSP
jgi:hypothetical protein